jgi:hypothetical protein
VTSNTASVTRRPVAPLARLLACVLLAFVAYTTTAGAVHRHGSFAPDRLLSSATAISPSGDADSSANESRSIGECLICQLRQQLSFSLLNALPQIVAPQNQTLRTPAVALSCFSRPESTQRGRGPPLASLI